MIADLKPYPEYKESGLPWLGQVPGHWGLSRSKRLFSARKDLALPEDVQLSATQAYGVIPQSDFEEKVGRRVVKISMHLEKRRHVERNDFVISMRSFQGGIERAWASGAIRSSYVVLKQESGVNVGFFAYLFKSHSYIRALQATADFIRDGQDLNFSNFCAVDLPTLPLAEQAAIVRFLDWANGRLERTIRAKRKAIALLTEQKQAIIHRAVTRGLDPSVPIKPSGIPWLGDIPRQWEICSVKRLARRGGKTFTDGDWIELPFITDSGVRLIQTGNVGRGHYREKGFRFISEETFKAFGCTEVVPNDVLICRLDGPVGRACLAPQLGVRMITSVDNTILKLRAAVDARFVVCLMSSSTWLNWIQSICRAGGGFRYRISRSMLGAIQVPTPPLFEQQAIVKYIEDTTAPISRAISRLEREIELLREYRTRLVTDVVTGKLDVREAAGRLPEEAAPGIDEEPVDLSDEIEPSDEEAAV